MSSPTAAEILRLGLRRGGGRGGGRRSNSSNAFAWRRGGREREREEAEEEDFADDEGDGGSTVVVSRARLAALTALASSGTDGSFGRRRQHGDRRGGFQNQQHRGQGQPLFHYGRALLEQRRSPSPNGKKSKNAANAPAASTPSTTTTTSLIDADALARRHSVAGERVFLTASALVRLPPATCSPERRVERRNGNDVVPPRGGGHFSAPFPPAAAAAATATTSSSSSPPLCRVCWDSPAAVALLPCGHVGTCLPCTVRLLTAKGAALAAAEDEEFALDDDDDEEEEEDEEGGSDSSSDDGGGEGRERRQSSSSGDSSSSFTLLAAASRLPLPSSRETAAESVGRAVAGGVPCPFCQTAVADFARVYIV